MTTGISGISSCSFSRICDNFFTIASSDKTTRNMRGHKIAKNEPSSINTYPKFHRERKFILGNARGEVAVHNFRNGAKMKDLDTQAGPIVGLIYCAQEKAILVACQARPSLSVVPL